MVLMKNFINPSIIKTKSITMKFDEFACFFIQVRVFVIGLIDWPCDTLLYHVKNVLSDIVAIVRRRMMINLKIHIDTIPNNC